MHSAEIVDASRSEPLPFLGGGGYRLLLGVTLPVALYAALGWRARLAGSGEYEVWPLSVVNLVFFLATIAGLILASGVVAAVGTRPPRASPRGADVIALGALVLAATLVLLDLARPARLARLVRPDHFGVPVAWDFLIAVTYFLLAFALDYLTGRRDVVASLTMRGSLKRKLEALLALAQEAWSPARSLRERHAVTRAAGAALPAALLLYAMTASILGSMGARPGWYAALIAPIFVVPSLISGVALWTLVIALASTRAGGEHDGLVAARLGRALACLTPVLALYLVGELFFVPYREHFGHVVREMLAGSYAPLVLAGLVGGVVTPFGLLALPRTPTPRRIALAAGLVVAGVLVARWHLVVAGVLGHAHPPGSPGSYVPAWPEVTHIAASYGVALLMCALALRAARRVPGEHSRVEDQP